MARTIQWGIENGLPASPEANSVHTNVRGNQFIFAQDEDNPQGAWYQYWDDTVITAPAPSVKPRPKPKLNWVNPLLIVVGLGVMVYGFTKTRN